MEKYTAPACKSCERLRAFLPVRLISCLFLLFVFGNSLSAQQTAKNSLYVEGATRGPVYSINYDRLFSQGKKLAWSFRAGFSYYDQRVAFPVGVNLITGQNEHHAEFSLSIIPFIDGNPPAENDDGSDKSIFLNPAIGYRYQKSSGGLFLKAAAGPSLFLDPPSNDFWDMDPKVYLFASIGAGFSF